MAVRPACIALAMWLATGNAIAAGEAPATRRAGNVTVIAVDGTTLGDWLLQPRLSELLASGAAGLLSTRAGESPSEAGDIARAAYVTLGAGARTADERRATALSDALRSRAPLQVADPAETSSLPAHLVRGVLGAEPISRAEVTDGASGIVPHGPVWGSTIAEADTLIRRVRDRMGPDDVLIVLSAFAPAQRHRARRFLAPIAITGAGIERGLLTSPTTRRTGLVSLADVAPTILHLLGRDVPTSMRGRPMTVEPGPASATILVDLERDLLHAARSRSRLLRGMLVAAMLAAGIIALLLVRRRRVPALFPVVLSAVSAAPLVLLLEPLLPGTASLPVTAPAVAGASLGLGVAARRWLGGGRAPAALALIAALAVLADLAFGAPLAGRSPGSYLLAEGARFYGIGNEMMGVVIGGLLAGSTILVARFRYPAPMRAGVLAGATALMAAPGIGAKLGSVFTAVPAFGLYAATTGGRRVGKLLLAALVLVTLTAAGAVVLADRLSDGASHIGGVGGPGTDEVLTRKIGAALRLLAFSIWAWASFLLVAATGIVLAWRRDLARRAATLGPALRAGAVALVLAVLTNDAGAVAAAFIAVPLASSFLCGAAEPEKESPQSHEWNPARPRA